jgi:transposase-like protein
MPCPDCGSTKLLFREATGLEWLVLLFISRRKYRCFDCKRAFRAFDRSGESREEPEMVAKTNPASTI